jgi:hypothetical protein
MTKPRLLKELFLMTITCFAIFQAVKSIYGSVDRQLFLLGQVQMLKDTEKQALEMNKDLCDGLNSYHSASGIERLARERLNLVGKDEIMIRIGK